MHFCRAHIAIGGDDRNVMFRGDFSPVSWPEIEILRIVHGDASVTEVEPFVAVAQHPREERTRLSEIYGDGIAAQAWGGRNAPGEMEAPDVRVAAGIVWFNPLTHEIELTGEDGRSAKVQPTDSQPASLAESVGDMTPPPPEPEPVEDDELEVVGEASPPKRERTATGTFLPRNK